MPADGLAPLCARASAGAVMTKVESAMHTGPHLEGLIHRFTRVARFRLQGDFTQDYNQIHLLFSTFKWYMFYGRYYYERLY